MIIPKLQYIHEFLCPTKSSKKINTFGLLYRCWSETSPLLYNAMRTKLILTFSTPFDSLFIDDNINDSWGKGLNKKNLHDKWNLLKSEFSSDSIIIFTDGSSNNRGLNGAGIFNANNNSSIPLDCSKNFQFILVNSMLYGRHLIFPF